MRNFFLDVIQMRENNLVYSYTYLTYMIFRELFLLKKLNFSSRAARHVTPAGRLHIVQAIINKGLRNVMWE